jgi:hypothetical protein
MDSTCRVIAVLEDEGTSRALALLEVIHRLSDEPLSEGCLTERHERRRPCLPNEIIEGRWKFQSETSVIELEAMGLHLAEGNTRQH